MKEPDHHMHWVQHNLHYCRSNNLRRSRFPMTRKQEVRFINRAGWAANFYYKQRTKKENNRAQRGDISKNKKHWCNNNRSDHFVCLSSFLVIRVLVLLLHPSWVLAGALPAHFVSGKIRLQISELRGIENVMQSSYYKIGINWKVARSQTLSLK